MTHEDYSRKLELMIEQGKVWSEIQREIDSWHELLDTIMKEFDEKCSWAHKHLASAIKKQSKEFERFNLLIKEIDDKYKEESA